MNTAPADIRALADELEQAAADLRIQADEAAERAANLRAAADSLDREEANHDNPFGISISAPHMHLETTDGERAEDSMGGHAQ